MVGGDEHLRWQCGLEEFVAELEERRANIGNCSDMCGKDVLSD